MAPCISLPLVGIFLLLTSCTTTAANDVLAVSSGKERKEMTGLEDMSLEYIKAQWGEPDADVAKGDGRVIHYKNIKSQDLDAVEGDSNVKSCLIRLDLNKDLLVTGWEYESCRSDE